MKHCTDLDIKASFLDMTKIQAAIILPIKTRGIKENKRAYTK
jgi:hypothetical protein